MVVVAIIGNPSSGKRTLATALCARRPLAVIGTQEVGAAISTATTPIASEAKGLVERGDVLPGQLFGALLAEVVGELDAVIVGLPRTLDELQAFLSNCASPVSVIHLRASQAVIDARRHAVGLRPIEVEHPGALQRLSKGLAPVLAAAGRSKRLLELDANLLLAELVEHADRFLDATS